MLEFGVTLGVCGRIFLWQNAMREWTLMLVYPCCFVRVLRMIRGLLKRTLFMVPLFELVLKADITVVPVIFLKCDIILLEKKAQCAE